MLRIFVLLLLLLNGLYFAWVQGLLRDLGLAPVQQTEPQRLTQQIKPEAVRLLSAQEWLAIESPARVTQKPTECLQAGVFDADQGAQLRQALAAWSLPAGSWSLEATVEPARWIIYLGQYVSVEAMNKKRAELATLKVKFEALRNPALELGLSMGGFETQAAATAALDVLVRRGVRTARVVQELAEVRGFTLRLPTADDDLRTRLNALKPGLADKTLIACQ
jgi:hypothetical protein